MDFPGGSDSNVSVYNAGDPGSIPGSGRSPGEGNGNPLQYYCLENPMDRGAWWATVHGVAESDTTKHTRTFFSCSKMCRRLLAFNCVNFRGLCKQAQSWPWPSCYLMGPHEQQSGLKLARGFNSSLIPLMDRRVWQVPVHGVSKESDII